MRPQSSALRAPLPFLLLMTACVSGHPPALDLYVSSAGTDQVLRYDAVSGEFRGVFVGPRLGGPVQPTGLRFGPDGNLYVSSYETGEVKRYSATDGRFVDDFVTPTGIYQRNLLRPTDLAFGPDGDLYVLSHDRTVIKRYDGLTGTYGSSIAPTPNTSLDRRITGLEFGPDGYLYVGLHDSYNPDYPSGGVVKRFVGSTGEFVDDFAEFNVRLDDLTFGPDGDLYVLLEWTSQAGEMVLPIGSAVVWRYDEDSAAWRTVMLLVPESDALRFAPKGIRFGPDGDLFVSHLSGISRYFLGHFVADVVPGFYFASRNFDFGPDDHLYFSTHSRDEVKRWDVEARTLIETFVRSPESAGGLSRPAGLAFGPDVTGDDRPELYVASNLTHEVKLYDGATGEYLRDVVGAWLLQNPAGLAFGPDGHLYVASHGSDRVLRYRITDPVTGAGSLDVLAEVPSPTDLAFGPDGHLYVTSEGAAQVIRYHGTTGEFMDTFPPPLPEWNEFSSPPKSLVFAADGALYVSAGRLYRFDPRTGEFLGTRTPGNFEDLIHRPGGDLYEGILFGSALSNHNIWQDEPGNYDNSLVEPRAGGLSQPWGLALGRRHSVPLTLPPRLAQCEADVYPSKEGELRLSPPDPGQTGSVLRPGSAVRIACVGSFEEVLGVEMDLYTSEGVDVFSLEAPPHLSNLKSSGARIGVALPRDFSGAPPGSAFLRVRYRDAGDRERAIEIGVGNDLDATDFIFIPAYVTLLGVKRIEVGWNAFGHEVEGVFPGSIDTDGVLDASYWRLAGVSLETVPGFNGTARLAQPCSPTGRLRQGYHMIVPPFESGAFPLFFYVIAPRGVIPPEMDLLDGYEVLSGIPDVALSGGVPDVASVFYSDPAGPASFPDDCP